MNTCRAAMDTIRAAGYEDFGLERFFLSEELDSVPALGRDVSPPTCDWPCTRRTLRNILDTDATLIDRLNRGHLFVTYQGHGNRNLVTHEYVLVGNGIVSGPPGVPEGILNDAARLGNVGKPAIWFFNACHVAEFARQDENNAAPVFVGDCLSERLLFRPDAGAIAVVASTGFELLTHVDPINRITFSSWFSRPEAADPYSGEPRLLLGEIMLGAKNLLVAQSSAYEGIVESYVTLGDPTLRVDIAPPRFKVWQDRGDRPWEDDAAPEPFASGAPIRASDPDRDDAFFAARIFDEVPIASDSIAIGVREGGVTTWVDPANYTLTPGDPDPQFGLVRSYELHYTAPLTPSDFDLVFRAVDANDRVMDLVLEARTNVRFYEVDDAGGSGSWRPGPSSTPRADGFAPASRRPSPFPPATCPSRSTTCR